MLIEPNDMSLEHRSYAAELVYSLSHWQKGSRFFSIQEVTAITDD